MIDLIQTLSKDLAESEANAIENERFRADELLSKFLTYVDEKV